ncbi:MAG TPA: AAA family ATPase [Bryobacteraceae bacterium]|nr:AAA family ATPase [Bryobacteraceae bacterium]
MRIPNRTITSHGTAEGTHDGARDDGKSGGLLERLTALVVGQAHAMEQIVPYVQMHQASLAPEGRPAGVFLLLGPTGTGKTRTVEALAEVLHGSDKRLLRVDCGEFQMEHEVAKLIGAPPGYLGHRETPPVLTQQKLAAAASDDCDLSLVLFDEIEKAAPSMTRLLLGVLDKAALRLGDNTTVNFERTLIFLTSNVGARELRKELRPDFGFEALAPAPSAGRLQRLDRIGAGAVRRKFSPEFVNRIDAVITYQPLGAPELAQILELQLEALDRHISKRLGVRAFTLELDAGAREFLLAKGTSSEYGARELKRTILRSLTQPLAALVAAGAIEPGAIVRASVEHAKPEHGTLEHGKLELRVGSQADENEDRAGC